MSKTKLIVLLTVFLDVLGLTIMIPAMPNLVDFYHTSYFMITLGMTIYSLFGLFATPILGAMSDKYGRKNILLYSIAGTIASYVTLALSTNIWIFLLARVINGISAGNIGTLQSILTDISENHKERMVNLGYFGVIFGLGFVIGPTIGGIALKGGIHTPFRMSAILATLNIIFIFFFLPETNKILDKAKKIKTNIIHIFKDMFTSPERHYYMIFFIINLAIMIYQTSFLLFLNNKFGVSGTVGGYILGSYGLIMMINQGFFFKKFRLKLPNRKLILISIIGSIVSYGLAFLTNNFYAVIIFVGISGIFQGIFRPVFQNIILGNNQEEVGLINGNLVNIGNLTSIIGPVVGGILIDHNISPFGLVTLLIILAYFCYQKRHKKSAL